MRHRFEQQAWVFQAVTHNGQGMSQLLIEGDRWRQAHRLGHKEAVAAPLRMMAHHPPIAITFDNILVVLRGTVPVGLTNR